MLTWLQELFAWLQSAELISYRFVNDYLQNKRWLDLKLRVVSAIQLRFFLFSLACGGASVFCCVLMRLCVILLSSKTPWTCFRRCSLTPKHCQKLWRCRKTSSVYEGKALTHPHPQTESQTVLQNRKNQEKKTSTSGHIVTRSPLLLISPGPKLHLACMQK